MKQLTKILAAIIFVAVLTTPAQNKDYTKEPGYVEFGDLSVLEDGQTITEVFIEENLLKMVAKLARHEEPEVADLINGLKLVKVNTYEITDNNEKDILNKMESINKNLEGKDWQRIVRRRSPDENAYVYVKADGSDKFIGLVVLAMDQDGEAAFVNIVGDIDLNTIGRLTDKFDIPALNNVNKKDEQEKESE